MPGSRSLIRYWGAVPVLLAIALLALRACVHTPPLDQLAKVASEPRDPPGSVAYQGSVLIARGGPVKLGFQSPGPALLTIGTGDPMRGDAAAAKQLAGKGDVVDRYILPPGPLAIRFAAPPGARLVWVPIGRRGDPEYLPASSLSPEPPASARFGSNAGTSPLDGLVALGLLLVVVGSALMLARAHLRAVPRATWLAIGGVFVLGLVVRLVGLGDAGDTFDENVNWSAGRNYITNVVALDASPGSWKWNFEHPPVMKYLFGIGAQFTDGFAAARVISAIVMALGCALLVPIGTRLYNPRAGLLAGLVATLLPHLVAHGQIVGHEAPTVLWWSLGILLALCVWDGEPSARQLRLRLVAVGVAIGVGVASRFVNGMLGPVCLAIVIIQAPAQRRWRSAVEAGVIMPIVAFVTLVVLWPRLWSGPIAGLQASLAHLSKPHGKEPFLGVFTEAQGPHYFVVYLAATLPVVILGGVIAWLVRGGRERSSPSLIVAIWFVMPLAVMFSPVKQDGVRYVLPCMMALAVMSAAGWEWLCTLADRRWPRARSFTAIAAVVTLYLGITLARFKPYYLDYYNELVGGPGNVARGKLLEIAWWGEGLVPAVNHINTHAKPGDRVFRNCIGAPGHLAFFRHDLWNTLADRLADADWVLWYSPYIHPCPTGPGFERAFVVEVQGATLAVVYKRVTR